MKQSLSFLLLSLLCFPLWAQEEESDFVPYAVDKETGSLYHRAIEAISDSATVFALADSIDARAIDGRYHVMSNELRAWYGYMVQDETIITTYIEAASNHAREYIQEHPDDIYCEFMKRSLCSLRSNFAVFYANANNFYKAFQISKELLEEAKQMNDPYCLYGSYMNMGELYEQMDQAKLAIEQYLACKKVIEGAPLDQANKNGLLLNPYCELGGLYYDLGDIQTAEKYFDLVLKIDPNAIIVPYTRAKYYLNKHDLQGFKAQYNLACNMAPASDGTTVLIRPKLEMMNAAATGRVGTALEIAEQINDSEIDVLGAKAAIYKWAGNYKEALQLSEQYKLLRDSLRQNYNSELLAEMTAEMRTIYDTAEKEAKIMRQRYTLYIGAIILLAILIILAGIVYNNVEIRKKNKALAANINQILDMRRKEKELARAALQQKVITPAANTDDTTSSIVQQYIEEITNKNLFCDPNFDRMELLDQMHIQKSGFWKQFEEETGTTALKYILNLRMEYAAEQIRQHPEYTIEAIAADCGIPSRTTFYRNFVTRFGITPNVFREQCNIQ